MPAAHDQAASHFPSWRIGGDSEGLLGHNLQFVAGCDGQPARSPVGTVFPTGYESSFVGKGLPLALLHTGQNGTSDVLVMSPVHAFVSSAIAVANLSDGSQSLAAGVVGSVTSIPAGYTMHTVLTMPAAGSGFTEAMMHWGDTMLALGGGKARAKHNAAPMISHLGYSTTAFYFCEFVAVQFVQHSLPLLTPPLWLSSLLTDDPIAGGSSASTLLVRSSFSRLLSCVTCSGSVLSLLCARYSSLRLFMPCSDANDGGTAVRERPVKWSSPFIPPPLRSL